MNPLCDSPIFLPGQCENPSSSSSCDFSILSGPSITLWMAGNAGQETRKDLKLVIAPDRPVIIGRAEGNPVPYLDPSYRATTMLPGSGSTILRSDDVELNNRVSRAHFMLRAIPRGILIVNGVPKVGGGIRPPLNGTRLHGTRHRDLAPAEELVVESRDAVILILPNGTNIWILAE